MMVFEILLISAGIWLTDYILPSVSITGNWWNFLILGAVVWVIYKIFYKPLSFILSPIKIITLGFAGVLLALAMIVAGMILLPLIFPFFVVIGILGIIYGSVVFFAIMFFLSFLIGK